MCHDSNVQFYKSVTLLISFPQVESEEYDPEIFDDTDFYTRALEEVLKAKVSLSDDMTDVSRKWIEIQNLRRKAKKKVDKKASKGRKIRYEVCMCVSYLRGE